MTTAIKNRPDLSKALISADQILINFNNYPRCCSLRDVLRLRITQVIQANDRLGKLTPLQEDPSVEALDELLELAEQMVETATEFNLGDVNRAAQHLKESVETGKHFEVINFTASTIQQAVNETFNDRRFVFLREPYADWYKSAERHAGKDVRDKFSELWPDYREACYCYACEHFLATQLLLGRVLEGATRRLAKQLKITLTIKGKPAKHKDYSMLCDQILAALKARQTKALHTRKQAEKDQQFAVIGSFLSNARIAWRNSAAHPGIRDAEVLADETLRLLNSVTDMLKAFAALI